MGSKGKCLLYGLFWPYHCSVPFISMFCFGSKRFALKGTMLRDFQSSEIQHDLHFSQQEFLNHRLFASTIFPRLMIHLTSLDLYFTLDSNFPFGQAFLWSGFMAWQIQCGNMMDADLWLDSHSYLFSFASFSPLPSFYLLFYSLSCQWKVLYLSQHL